MKVVILASGTGTLLQAVIDSADETIDIVAVGSDRPCQALERAEAAGVPTFCVEYMPKVTDREKWNRTLSEKIAEFDPDLVLSAGFMRIIGPTVVERFAHRIINTHPALLPSFPGAHAVADALNYGVRVTGSTVHVVDSGVDTGPIVAQRAVPVEPNDTVETLHERIKTVERALLVEVLRDIAQHGLTIDGRKAWIEHP
ncbi:phosphoribosylglycinamide formyltransferase [Corynebacterium anserum]|uniref:Phosphoribosylglycinamide formyltransferase n=1 Tax=Corynebacterium anserum TaxID=2684406 RepID=A0A7G7YPK9_9CORY|nr:phosphoribosylglycinamide formyltransferase [Corynebacterium anserum]MBC2682060.1 phosphoribosylglycinamide formyltransferase [Corynebacterium anserum]QNH96429.1 phosphoribosylglycinamide formyltransferase [Corynebacterium anserum]